MKSAVARVIVNRVRRKTRHSALVSWAGSCGASVSWIRFFELALETSAGN